MRVKKEDSEQKAVIRYYANLITSTWPMANADIRSAVLRMAQIAKSLPKDQSETKKRGPKKGFKREKRVNSKV